MRRLGQVLGGWFATALSIAIGLTFLIFLNGGAVYRTQCPTSDGRLKTDWELQWMPPIPYLLGPSEEGCETHTGTRILLSQVGIAKLDEKTAGQLARETTAKSDPAVAYLGAVSGVIFDLQKANRDKVSYEDYYTVMENGGAELRALAPPAFLSTEHQTLLGHYETATKSARQYLDAEAADEPSGVAGEAMEASLVAFSESAERIRLAVVENQTG